MRYLYLGIFGLMGVFLRYAFGLLTSLAPNVALPFTTLLINVLGSFLIGVAYVISFEYGYFSEDLRTGLLVGLLGGFTTFSSYSLESIRLMEIERWGLGVLYFVLTPLLCLLATYMGLKLTRFLMG